MRLYLLLIALPVLGLPGPKHKKSSTPSSWWSPSISPSNSPIRPGAIGWSSTPQYSPTPHLSSSVPISIPPRSSSRTTPSKSLSLPRSSSIVGSTKVNSVLSTKSSHTPKPPFTPGKSSSSFFYPSSSVVKTRTSSPTSHAPSKYAPGSHSSPSRPSSTNESSEPTSSGQVHSSNSTATDQNQSTTVSTHSSKTRAHPSSAGFPSSGVPPHSASRESHLQTTTLDDAGPSTITSSSQNSTHKGDSPPTRSLSLDAAPDWTPTDRFQSPGAMLTDSKPTETGIFSLDAASETYSRTQTGFENDHSATRSMSSSGESNAVTETTASTITPDPSKVTISETETVEGVEENTIYKTEKDGHETSIPILFGLGCLIFCNTGALLLWGIGPDDGIWELPPIPEIVPLPKIIDIKHGVPTPQGTQGEDSEPTKSLASETEESTTSSESTSSESTTTEATTTESTSTCTRATITNCDITTSCGPKTCSTITSCEPTVTDCTAAGTTVSTTTSEKYELDMAVYTGHSLATPTPSSTSTSDEPSYELAMAVYTGHSLATPSPSSNSTSVSPSYELTMAVYTGHSLATPSPSSNSTSISPAYEFEMAVYTGHSLATPSRSPTPSYELTMAVYTGHRLVTPSRSSTPASSTPRYQFTMAVYTGHTLAESSTFRTYKITTTLTVGGSSETTETTKTKSSTSEVTEISPPTEKASCYPKQGDTEEEKVLTIDKSRLNNFCGDSTKVLQKLRNPPRVDYVEAGWTLDDDVPESCDELPTTDGDSEGYWVCTVALGYIIRDCPWNGGTIRTACGEFRLRGCIGPCDD